MTSSAFKCYRIGCEDLATRGVRDKDGSVLSFCPKCFKTMIRSHIIDRYTGKILVS